MMKERFDQSNRYWERIKSHFDQQKKLDELMEMTRGTRQRLAGLEQYARQRRLTMEADEPSDTKSRERMKGAAKVVQAMHGGSFSANRVNPDPICSTSFGVKIESPALPSRDDVVVENSAAALKSCLSPLEMRSPTAAGVLLPTSKTTIAT